MPAAGPRPSSIVVTPYDRRREDEVAAMLARAFVDDPLYRWMWPGDASRLRRVTAFISAELRISARAGRVDLAVDGDGRLLGAALWALPGRYPFPTALSARVMAGVMRRLGAGAALRLPRLLRVEKAHPDIEHWYLVTLGVDPAAQGHGTGRTLVMTNARQADADGVPIYLETFNPANPAYYRALGFVDREHIDSGDLPPFWTMLRPAGTTAAA